MISRFVQPPKLDRWDDYFEEGETLLWQGAPEPGPHNLFAPAFLSIFGIPFLLAGLGTAGTGLSQLVGGNWTNVALGLFLMAFSVPFVCVGTGLTFGTWFYLLNEHRFTRYALSNKRAYIAKSFWRHTLDTYRIGPDDVITLDQGKTDTVLFKTVHGRDSDGDKTTQKVGFKGIANGAEVYKLVRSIQNNAHDEF